MIERNSALSYVASHTTLQKVDKVLGNLDTFGDSPEAFVDEILDKLDGEIKAIHY